MAIGRRRAGARVIFRRAVRSLRGKRGSRSLRRHAKTTFRRKKSRMPMLRTGTRKFRTGGSGDGILGKVVSLNINHKKGVTYERKEKFDVDHTLGAGTLLSVTGAQGVYGRSFLQGNYANSGTDVQAMWNAHGITLGTQSRKIKSTQLDMQCVSASTGIQQVTVYLLRANRDTQATSMATTSPRTAWEECATEITNVQAPTVLGETPFITGFGNYWKIVKTQKLVLNPGQCFRIKIKTNEHWGPSFATLGRNIESASAYTNIRNRTYGLLLVNHGMPVADATTNTLINYGSAKLNFTWKWKILSSTKIHQQENKVFFTNTIDPPGTITDAVEVGDDDGMRITHATA